MHCVAERLKSPLSGGRCVPEKVDYASACGALCRKTTSKGTLAMQARLLMNLSKLIKEASPGKKLAKAASADLVLAVETYQGAAERRFCRFYSVASALGPLGRNRPQANMVELQVEEGVAQRPFEDVLLSTSRYAFVPGQSQQSPLHLARLGPLQLKTEEDVTAEWCFMGDALVDEVHLVPLRWLQVSGGFDRVHIQGIRHDLGEVVVCRVVAKVDDLAPPLPPPPPTAEAQAPLDFLDDMLQAERAHASKRRRGAKATVEPEPMEEGDNVPEPPVLVDPLDMLLADLCNGDELAAELELIMKEVVGESPTALRRVPEVCNAA